MINFRINIFLKFVRWPLYINHISTAQVIAHICPKNKNHLHLYLCYLSDLLALRIIASFCLVVCEALSTLRLWILWFMIFSFMSVHTHVCPSARLSQYLFSVCVYIFLSVYDSIKRWVFIGFLNWCLFVCACVCFFNIFINIIRTSIISNSDSLFFGTK